VAAREDQLEPLVGDRRLLVGRELRRTGEQLRLPRERLLAPDPVDRAVPGRGDDPGAGARRCAVDRPALGRLDECVLNRVLGEVEIAEDAAEDRDAARTLVAVGTDELVYPRFSGVRRACLMTQRWTTGRTSTVPPRRADGMRAATASAAAAESASIT
jgi:hypothetical protein